MQKITEIEKKLKKKLSPKIFNKLAQETGFVQRKRKVEGFDIFWSIISGFVIGQATEIAGMHRAFMRDTGTEINYSAWHNRLAKEGFSQFMRKNAEYLINHVYTQHLKDEGLLKRFSDILIQDGSSMAINDLLKNAFPGRFTKVSPAAVELHMFFSLRYGNFHGLDLAADSVSEYEFMPKAGEYQLANTLCLFDRGYNALDRLHEIEDAQGFFVVRMKDNMTPRVLYANYKDQRGDVHFKNRLLRKIWLVPKQNCDLAISYDKKNNFDVCASLLYGTQ